MVPSNFFSPFSELKLKFEGLKPDAAIDILKKLTSKFNTATEDELPTSL
jgi:hypothetical protein